MAKKQKFYVVWKGKETGVFSEWQQCQAAISHTNNPIYKSFDTKHEADMAFQQNPPNFKQSIPVKSDENYTLNAIAVDAGSHGNPGPVEYRGIDLLTNKEVFYQGPYQHGTNNIAEFLGIIHALALLDKRGDTKTIVYTDSNTGISWLKKKQAKTTLKRTTINEPLFSLIDRALIWINAHPKAINRVVKWDTEKWGEIPADFGRK